MATYEFKCQECGHRFEQKLLIQEREKFKPKCPKCSSKKVVQMISSVFVKTSSKT